MKNSFYRFLLYAFVLILFFVMLISFVFRNYKLSRDVSSNVSVVVSKVDSVISVPFTALAKSHDVISDFLSTYSENRDLKKSLSTLENQSAVISNLQEENDSLRASLNLSDKLSRNNVITAEVSMRPSVTWLKELTINIGKSKSVSKSMLATSNGGVIGFITKIYDHSTTISLLSNSSNDSYIACSVKGEDGSQIFGIISSYDNKKKLLEMTQLNSSSDVKVGSEVVTSGLDDLMLILIKFLMSLLLERVNNMKFFKFSVTPYWLSIIPFLWDGHISMLLNYYFSPELFLSSHLFIIYLFILTLSRPYNCSLLYLVCLGFLYDTYYFKTLGIVIITLPLLSYLFSQLLRFVKRNAYVDCLLAFLFLFLFDTLNFGFALYYGLTNEYISDFIIYQLSPSLVFNLLIFILIKPFVEKLFLYLSVDRFK